MSGKKIGTFEEKEVAEKFIQFIEPLTTSLMFHYVKIVEHPIVGRATFYYVDVSPGDFVKWKKFRHLLDWKKFHPSGTKYRHIPHD